MSTEDGRRNPRSTTATKVPGIPKVPTKVSAELRQYLTSLGEALEIRLGRKGDPRDRAVTLRELTDGGLSGVNLRVGTVTTTGPQDDPTADFPVTPVGFVVTGGFSYIFLRWNWPGQSYSGHSLTEIWRNTVDDRTEAGGNQRIGISPGTTFIDRVGSDASFYYWIRHVNVNGVEGPFNATAGTLGETQPDVTYLTSLLAGAIGESELNQTLTTTIDDIETAIADLETTFGSTSSAAASALAAQNSATAAAADAAATAADALATAADVLATAADVVAAGGSASLAATSATNAAASESNASQSASNASSSETSAAGSASNAAGSASAAASSATNAANSASAASASEGNASTSEQAAAASESNAAGSESAAALSATAAAGSASNASQSAANAASSATQAATSESNAAGSASSASSSATNAAASESAASQSEANAASSETSAATSESNAAGSASGAASSATNAAASANAANTSAGNAATSETAAAGSATNAAGSASIAQSESSNAATSATQAAGSATAAQTSASGAASSASAAAASATASAYNFNQITARLDDVSGNSSGVTVEQAYQVTATNQDDITDLEGQYTIKIDTGGTVAGFGLASSSNTFSGSSSEFYVRADRFAVLPATTVSNGSFPTTNLYAGRTVYRSDLDETYYYDATNSQWSTTLNHLPFAVVTSPTTLQGQSVPAGVYIDTAFMNKGRVLDLIAGSVVADFITATAALSAPNIFGGTFNMGQISYNNSTDPRDWTITSANTRVSNFSVDALGVMHANAAVLEGLTVKAADGTILVKAGGMLTPSGANMVFNPTFKSPEYVANNNNTGFTASTTLLLGWKLTSGTISVNLTNGYADLSSTAYMDSTGQRFHATEGEKIYLYAEHNQSSGAGVAVQLLGYSTPDTEASPNGFIQGSFTSVYVGAAISSGRAMGTEETDVSGRYLSVGCATIQETGYYSVRLYANGSAVRYYMVGASVTPPVIDPIYAPTYIRDLSVDTLQIAGAAVSAPEGNSSPLSGTLNLAGGTSSNPTANWGDIGSSVSVSWDSDANAAPQAMIVIGSFSFVGSNGSGGDAAAASVNIRPEVSFGSGSTVTNVGVISNSFAYGFGGQVVTVAHIDLSGKGSPATVQLQGYQVNFDGSNTRALSRYTISAFVAKR